MTTRARRRTPPRRNVPALDAELVDWVEAEADRRVVPPRLVLERAVYLLRRATEVAPDLVDLPEPIGRARSATPNPRSDP